MECCCGCGIRIRGRDPQELNLKAVEIALELLVWDKARARQAFEPAERERFDRLIYRGANCYGRLLAGLHGEREMTSTAEAEDWLEESRSERSGRKSMTDMSFFSHGEPKLDEQDLEQLDRQRPEQSFSGQAKRAPATGEDLVSALERLSGLHAQGVLDDDEFAAAKARLIGRDD